MTTSLADDRVRPLFAEQQPVQIEDITPSYVEMAQAIAAICASRMLLLIAVVTGAAIWGYTCYDPMRDRLYVAIAFSIVFVLPQVALYYRKG